MSPDLLLRIAAALTGFVLKTAVAFGVCWVLSWLVDSPSRRFTIWLGYLYGTGVYWLWLASAALAGGQIPAIASHTSLQPATVGAWQIPGSWAFPLGVAFRVIGILYLLVLSYILFTHVKKRRHLKWVLKFTCKPPVEIAGSFHSLAENLRVGRSRLLVLSGATSPATFGWIRPTILLPDICLEQDRSGLEDILRHELHHVRRWDFVWNEFALVCRALLFFHPAAWYAARKMQFDRELACDLAVVSRSPARRAEYAECLVRFARLNLFEDPKTWGIDFAASSEDLQARVHSILAGSRKPSGWLICLRTVCGLTLLAGFLGIVPSLAVLLSYSHQRILQPLTAEIPASRPAMETVAAGSRKVRLSARPAPRSMDATAASVSQPEGGQLTQPMPGAASSKVESTLRASGGPGPQLLRRPLASTTQSNTGAKQETVTLMDPDGSGQLSKTGNRDGKQALQQSATAAAGIYKRLSVLDRH